MDGAATERIILVVENTPDHAELIEAAFGESAVKHQVIAIADGSTALNYLHRRGEYENAPRPDLILLDLGLPGISGQELLEELKSTPQLRRIPVVILTLSDCNEDVLRVYALQGNCYVVKSSDRDRLFQIVKRIEEFWLGIVTLPVE